MLETDGDFEPVDGGLKNDFGSFLMWNGTVRGFFESGFRGPTLEMWNLGEMVQGHGIAVE
jgi:hypothetical protein